MKGVIFTIDSIFALVIAMASISILLYFHYFSAAPYSIRYAEAQNILSALSGTSVAELSNTTPIAYSIVRQSEGLHEIWPQLMNNSFGEAYTGYGPLFPFVSFVYNTSSQITSNLVAAYGNIYVGTVSGVFAFNATYGSTVWHRSSTPVQSLLVYDNLLIFANSTNISAVSPLSGSSLWSLKFSGISTQIVGYDNKIFFGGNDEVYAYYINGTASWSLNVKGEPESIAIIDGDVMAAESNGNLTIIGQQGKNAIILLDKPVGVSSQIASKGIVAYFGGGSYANASYINGSVVSGFPISISGQAVYNVVPYRSGIFYQLTTGLFYASYSGRQIWSFSIPSLVSPVSGASSLIATNGFVYSLWQNGLLITNISNSQFAFVEIPYSPIRDMIIAYGRLYIAAGDMVIAYGSCPVNPQSNIISAASQLYLNGYGSCADYLVSGIKAPENYSIFINNTFASSFHIAKFNGANAYASAFNQPWLNTTIVDVSLWLNVSSFPSAPTRIVSYGDNATYTGRYFGWFFFINPNGEIGFDIMNRTGQTPLLAGPLQLNKWYNVLGVYDGATLFLYVNGELAAEKTISTSILPPPPSINLTIGGMPNGNRFFDGYLANLQIYKMPIFAAAARELYSRGIASSPLSGYQLLAWYPLQGDANDYSNYFNPAYSHNLVYAFSNYSPSGYFSAFEISKASMFVPVVNFSSNKPSIVDVGVYAWR